MKIACAIPSAALAKGLRAQGWAVEHVDSLEDVWVTCDDVRVDVALVPLNDATEFWVAQFRERHDTHVLCLQLHYGESQESVHQRIAVLRAGADDVLRGPVYPEELHAQLRALYRRPRASQARLEASGAFLIDDLNMQVHYRESWHTMRVTHMRLLRLMADRGGWASRAWLLNEMYDYDHPRKINSIETAVCAIRRQLGKECIVSAYGKGYRLADA